MQKIKNIFILLFVSISFSQIYYSEYIEGSGYNKALEIYNYSNSTFYLDNFSFPNCTNGCDGSDWDYVNTFTEGATIAPGEVYVICHPGQSNNPADPAVLDQCDQTHNYLSNGDDAYGLMYSNGNLLDIIGEVGADPGTGWSVAGVSNATKDHTLVRKTTISSGNNGDWSSSAGTNADDSEWIVFDQNTFDYLGSHDGDLGDISGCIITKSSCR